jgi:hypothetical protein
MRFEIEFIRLAPRHGEPIVVETSTIEAAKVREPEARPLTGQRLADDFRIIEYNRMGDSTREVAGSAGRRYSTYASPAVPACPRR